MVKKSVFQAIVLTCVMHGTVVSMEQHITKENIEDMRWWYSGRRKVMPFVPLESRIRKGCGDDLAYYRFPYKDECAVFAAILYKVNKTALAERELPKIKREIERCSTSTNPIEQMKLPALIKQKMEHEKFIEKDPRCLFQHFPHVDSPKDIELFKDAVSSFRVDCGREGCTYIGAEEELKELKYIQQALDNARENKRC